MKWFLQQAAIFVLLAMIFILIPPVMMKIAPGFWLSFPPAASFNNVHDLLTWPFQKSSDSKPSTSKAAMQNIKTALVAYRNDLGRFPHTASDYNTKTLHMADEACLGMTEATNVLTSSGTAFPFGYLGKGREEYLRSWKGPYLDAPAEDAMLDAWCNKIRYCFHEGKIWLHSAGKDGQFEPLAKICKDPGYEGDDLFLQVGRASPPVP